MLSVVLAPTDDATWPALDEWGRLLPAWFVAACADDVAGQSCVVDRWSLRAWLYWFQPARRQWRWWGAEITGSDGLRVVLLVPVRPYLRGALEWLCRVAGAVGPAVS